MIELRSLVDEVRSFISDNKRPLIKWLLVSVGLTLALNLLLVLLPIMPLALLVAIPLVGWQYWEWKRRGKRQP